MGSGDDLTTAVAVMGEALRNHTAADEKQNDSIDRQLTEIKNTLVDLGNTLRQATQRIHEQREQAIEVLRKEIAATDAKAQEAKDGIAGVKIWTLTGAISGLAALISALWTLVGGKGHA